MRWLFGEEQARYLLTCAARARPRPFVAEAADAGVAVVAIGHVEGSDLEVQGLFRLPCSRAQAGA